MSAQLRRTVIYAIMIPGLAVSTYAAYKDTELPYEETFRTASALSEWHKGMSPSESSKPGELTSLFLEKGGPDGKSGAVKFHVPGKGRSSMIALELDPEPSGNTPAGAPSMKGTVSEN